MPEQEPQEPPEDQVARAKRLREHIESLKSGRPEPAPGRKPSIKEQVDERSSEAERRS